MKYIKITFTIVAFLTFSQSYAQEIKPGAKKRFEKIDTNSDDMVSLEEATAFFEGKTNKKGNPIDANKMFTNKDANEDGKLTLEEFAAKGKKKGKGKGKNKGKKKN